MEQDVFVIRPANLGDLDWLHDISSNVGHGFTSLQNDRNFLQKRLAISEQSFAQKLPNEDRIYLFIRENFATKERVAITGIDVAVGHKELFYNFQVSTIAQACEALDIFLEHKVLTLVNNFQHASELITTWVHPDYRGHSHSRSLSLARFLFMAQFSNLFNDQIIAEIRGVSDEQGRSPFWNAVGKHFFAMDFKRADYLTLTCGKQFIADLIPHDPIYIDLLPEAARLVIGTAHMAAQPAKHLLESEGFHYNQHIDIFDAGPVLSIERDKIKTIQNSKCAQVHAIQVKTTKQVEALIYNNRIDAKIAVANIDVVGTGDVVISERTAEMLEIELGEQIRYCIL
jgi:arginine N-succinyltransferase